MERISVERRITRLNTLKMIIFWIQMERGADPVAYRFRLMPSGEAIDKAKITMSVESLGQTETEEDTAMFLGPTANEMHCRTCFQTVRNCPGHSGVIKLPFPIVHPLISKDLIAVLEVFCIRCGNIPITEEQRKAIIAKSSRYKDIADAIKNMNNLCPYCNATVLRAYPIPIVALGKKSYNVVTLFSESEIKLKGGIVNTSLSLEDVKLIDNRRVHKALLGMSKKDEELLGFTNEYYRPGLFMIDAIVVAPPSARPSTARIGKRVVNSVKVLLRTIALNAASIESKLGKITLDKLSENNIAELLKELEPLCVNVSFLYAQGSDEEVNRLKQAVFQRQQNVSIVSYAQLPGKKQGNYRKYILGTRHAASSRTVATAEPYARIGTIAFPKEFAKTMAISEMVTEMNLQMMRMFAHNGPNKYPGANGFTRNGNFFEITDQNRETISSVLMPGDILDRHILHGDIVLNNRYPTLREESIDAMMTVVIDEQTFGMPLAGVEKKGLDFDGDEIQCFIPGRMWVSAEAILLQSQLMQFIAPKNGLPAIFGSGDVVIGIKSLIAQKILSKDDARPIFVNLGKELPAKDLSANEIFSTVLPKGLYFNSPKIKIIDGNIVDGNFEPGAICGENAYLLKSIAHNFGPYAAIKLLEDATKIAYVANRIIGQSISMELQLKPDYRKKANALINDRIEEMDEFSRKLHSGAIHVPFGHPPAEYQEIMQNINSKKHGKELIEILNKSLAGGMLDKNGLLRKYEQALMKTIISAGQIIIINTLPQMVLASNSRTLPFFPRYTDTAITRGYIREGYMRGLRFESHFFDCMAARHQIFSKGVSVAEQGYFERTLAFWLSSIIAGHFGELRNDSHRISTFTFGHLGIDFRRRIIIEEDITSISIKEFETRFAGCADEELEQLREIRKNWQEDIAQYANISSNSAMRMNNKCESPIDFEAMIERYAPTKREGKSPSPQEIWEITKATIQKLHECHASGGGKWLQKIVKTRIRAFKRILLPALASNRIIKRGYSKKDYTELCDAIVMQYQCALLQAGEPVGMKSALSLTEPLTQGVLHAIHKIATLAAEIGIQRSHGMDRFSELLQGVSQKHPVTTFVLRGEKKYDKYSCWAFAHEIETVILNTVMQKGQLIASSEIVPPEDKQFYTDWLKELPQSLKTRVRQLYVSPFKLKLYLDSSKMLLNRVTSASIAKFIMQHSKDEIAYVAIERTQKPITVAYVFFHSALDAEIVRNLSRYICSNLVINASGDFNNASVIQYDFNAVVENGELVKKPIYRIEANGKNLGFALSHPDVDPNLTFSNDVFEMIEYFGLAETRERLYEELLYETSLSSDLANLLKVHFQIIVDYLVCRGQVSALTRHGIRKNKEADPMAKMAFEETQKFLKLAVQEAATVPLDAAVPRTLYGLRLKEGSGYSDVRVKTAAIGSHNKSSVIANIGKGAKRAPKVAAVKPKPIPIGKIYREQLSH